MEDGRPRFAARAAEAVSSSCSSPERNARVEEAIRQQGGQPLNFQVARQGLTFPSDQKAAAAKV